MPMFAGRPSTMNSFLSAEIPQSSMADQQRLQISELHFDKFLTPPTFLCWKITFKNPSKCLFQFSLGGVEMVDSVDDFLLKKKKNIALNS